MYTKLLLKNYFCCLLCIRMSGDNINFDDKKIKKSEFYKNKKVSSIYDIDVNKILVPKEKPYGTKNSFKYFMDTMIMMLLDHYP